MIPRILVPRYVRPVVAGPGAHAARRRSTVLDGRTIVPADLPVVALDARTSIPAHVPLEVLAERVLVPRDMPAKPLETASAIPAHVPLTVLDSRVAVPKDARPRAMETRAPVRPDRLPELLAPDVLTTGEVNFLVKPAEEGVSKWRWAGRASSAVFHALLLVFVILQPKLFPYQPPTQEELELARRQLSFIYLPPAVEDVPKLPPQADSASPQIRIDPRVLRQVAPPAAELQPTPGQPEPERVVGELPAVPQQPAASAETQTRSERPREVVRLEPPKSPETSEGLVVRRASPGRALEESLRGALRGGGSSTGFAGGAPPNPGGGGTSYLGGNVELLTPTEGVDFTNYLARVLASVKRNWYAVIPESARLGDKGKVVLQFRIQRNGNVPFPEPALVATSGKEALDRAALSSIRASSPFEQLPPAFSGPFIELRFIFLYNLPLSYQ